MSLFFYMTDNHGIVYELFVIVDLTTYCMNTDRNAIIQNDLYLYVQHHYSNFSLNGPTLRYSPITGWILMLHNQSLHRDM